jgi:hypothetical protein
MAIQLAGYSMLADEDSDGLGISEIIQQRVNVLFNKDGGPPKIKLWEREKWSYHDSVFLGALRASTYFGIEKRNEPDQVD